MTKSTLEFLLSLLAGLPPRQGLPPVSLPELTVFVLYLSVHPASPTSPRYQLQYQESERAPERSTCRVEYVDLASRRLRSRTSRNLGVDSSNRKNDPCGPSVFPRLVLFLSKSQPLGRSTTYTPLTLPRSHLASLSPFSTPVYPRLD